LAALEQVEIMSPEYIATSWDPSADRTVEFAAEEFIFREGDLGTEMFIIHEGQVEILHEHAGGVGQIAVLDRGDFFGEMSILEDLPRNASARALTDVKVIMIDGATFDSMLRANPEIGIRIMRKLSRRLRETRALVNRDLEGKDPALVVHVPSGTEFGLPATGATTIGRRDPVTGIQPNVDLTDIDPERSSSRRHAKIYCEEDTFQLVEDIGATNGTFLDDSRIRTGIPVQMDQGSTVRFGLVELEFRID
jgi:hypothetical protein